MKGGNYPKEFTARAVIIGILLALILGGANAYLGLKVGMTVSASIPAAVLSMGILRLAVRLFRRFGAKIEDSTILENNIAQTIASAAESVAAGVIFTIPALFILSKMGVISYRPSIFEITVVALLGGFLGVIFMIPLRRVHIVEEDDKLPYPEGRACAEVLQAGEEGGRKALKLLEAFGVGAIFRFLQMLILKTSRGAIGILKEEISFSLPFKGMVIGADLYPALLGVGVIVGPRIAAVVFGGGAMAWLVLIPLLSHFGVPGSPGEIWSNYIRHIGAGIVAIGGVISVIESLPMMIRSFSATLSKFKLKRGEIDRTDEDLAPTLIPILAGIIAFLLIFFIPVHHFSLRIVTVIAVIIFSFFFVVVSSHIVGLVGSSNQPVSGMTIAALLAIAGLIKVLGLSGKDAIIATLIAAGVICVALGAAGDMSQDLKTGYLVKATPKWQQIGEFIGVTIGSLILGYILYVLFSLYGNFGGESLPAPQAVLMSNLTQGIFAGKAPWDLLIIGGVLGVIIRMMGISPLAFGVGLYLPIHLSTPIIIGGLLSKLLIPEENAKAKEEATLLSSGLIAGDAVTGLIMAFVAFFGFIAPKADLFLFGNYTSLISVLGYVVVIIYLALRIRGLVSTKGSEQR